MEKFVDWKLLRKDVPHDLRRLFKESMVELISPYLSSLVSVEVKMEPITVSPFKQVALVTLHWRTMEEIHEITFVRMPKQEKGRLKYVWEIWTQRKL